MNNRPTTRSGCEIEVLSALYSLGWQCTSLNEALKLKKNLQDIISKKKKGVEQWNLDQLSFLDRKISQINVIMENKGFLTRFKSKISLKWIDLKKFLILKKKERKIKGINKLDLETRQTFQQMAPTISGAIGEIKVINELKKLPPEYYVYNDYNYVFYKAFHWKKYDQWVKSVQIDHLILSPYGIFIIETKNYRQRTFDDKMNSRYSPIVQIERASTAIWYIIKKKSNINLVKIRKIIALTHDLITIPYQYISIVPVSKLSEKILYLSGKKVYSPDLLNRIRGWLQI